MIHRQKPPEGRRKKTVGGGSSPKKTSRKIFLSINEAAECSQVTRQAIYVAIRHKKLRAFKETARWNIHKNDLEDYRELRYSRSQSTFNGDPLYDNSRGFYSVAQTARMLNLSAQCIYQATRKGKLHSSRKGVAWIIHIDDIRQFSSRYLDQKSEKNH